MAPTSSVACKPTGSPFSKDMKGGINKCDAPDVALTPLSVSISEPGDGEVIDFACDLSSPYFRYTYNYEHNEKNKVALTNWLKKVMPIAFERTQFRDQEIIIHNGAIIEELIDSILIKYPIRLHTIVGLGGAYMIILISRLHEAGRGVGEDLVQMGVDNVALYLPDPPGSSPGRSSQCEAARVVRQLISNVGGGGNILHSIHVSELRDAVKEITGHSATSVLNRLADRTMIGKEPDMSYFPSYLPTLRQMQGLNPFPTFLGEFHYTDSATKGMFDCALQIDGSDFQSEYVLGVDIKAERRSNKLREVYLSIYDCTLEEMLRISRSDNLDNEQKAAVLQTALLKAQRARTDIQCLIDILLNPPQTVEQVQNLASQFRDRAREYWKGALGSFTYQPFEADEDFRLQILDLAADYSAIPTLSVDLNANLYFYNERIKSIQEDLTEFESMDVDRILLTTRAILANYVRFKLRRYSGELSVEKFVAGHKVDDDQWHFPIQAIMGIATAHARTGARISIDRRVIEALYKRMERIRNVPSAIGPLQIREDMIVPRLYCEFARRRFPGHTERTARRELQKEFERNHGVIIVQKIHLDYLTDNALSEISGEDTLGSDVDVSRGHRELLAADGAQQLNSFFDVGEGSAGANASSSSSHSEVRRGSRGARGRGRSGRKRSRR
uniref:ARAD1D27280p n=1 Tax=Blastobotrys adeninivorans TaxID=409370 RepID=A0A060TBE4_BLAAD